MAGLQSVASRFNELMDSLVHPALRREPDILHRARVLIALILFINVVVSVSGIVSVVGYVSPQTRLIGLGLCLTLIMCNFLLLYILRSRGNFMVCSLAETLLATAGIVGGIILSGGIMTSPVTQILVMPPLMVYFFAGKRQGNRAVLLILLVMLLLFLTERAGILVPVEIAVGDSDLLRALTSFLGVLSVSTMTMVFERNASKLKHERDAEHQKTLVLAQTDALTGLANRRSFDAQLNARISNELPVREFALCFIDLDGFKAINDRFGHAVGDEVLRAIALRLRQSARDHDVIGRQGGDEFTLIFDALTNMDATRLTMDRMLTLIAQPIATSAGPLSVGASAGLAVYPQHAATAEILKKAADQAMYAAKQLRNQWRMYDPISATKEHVQ